MPEVRNSGEGMEAASQPMSKHCGRGEFAPLTDHLNALTGEPRAEKGVGEIVEIIFIEPEAIEPEHGTEMGNGFQLDGQDGPMPMIGL